MPSTVIAAVALTLWLGCAGCHRRLQEWLARVRVKLAKKLSKGTDTEEAQLRRYREHVQAAYKRLSATDDVLEALLQPANDETQATGGGAAAAGAASTGTLSIAGSTATLPPSDAAAAGAWTPCGSLLAASQTGASWQYALVRLEPNMSYQFRIRARNGYGSWSVVSALSRPYFLPSLLHKRPERETAPELVNLPTGGGFRPSHSGILKFIQENRRIDGEYGEACKAWLSHHGWGVIRRWVNNVRRLRHAPYFTSRSEAGGIITAKSTSPAADSHMAASNAAGIKVAMPQAHVVQPQTLQLAAVTGHKGTTLWPARLPPASRRSKRGGGTARGRRASKSKKGGGRARGKRRASSEPLESKAAGSKATAGAPPRPGSKRRKGKKKGGGGGSKAGDRPVLAPLATDNGSRPSSRMSVASLRRTSAQSQHDVLAALGQGSGLPLMGAMPASLALGTAGQSATQQILYKQLLQQSEAAMQSQLLPWDPKLILSMVRARKLPKRQRLSVPPSWIVPTLNWIPEAEGAASGRPSLLKLIPKRPMNARVVAQIQDHPALQPEWQHKLLTKGGGAGGSDITAALARSKSTATAKELVRRNSSSKNSGGGGVGMARSGAAASTGMLPGAGFTMTKKPASSSAGGYLPGSRLSRGSSSTSTGALAAMHEGLQSALDVPRRGAPLGALPVVPERRASKPPRSRRRRSGSGTKKLS